MREQNYIGKSEFFWFVGVVEDRHDPLKLGRVRVRVYALHTDAKSLIPTEHLHWAMVVYPATQSPMSGVGTGPSHLLEGTTVYGFFFDGEEMQEPVIWGSLAGINVEETIRTLGFTDPREDLSDVPAPPASLEYADDGNGVTVGDRDTSRYPRADHVEEPDTPRLARNEGTLHSEDAKQKSRTAGQTGVLTASHSSAGGSDSDNDGSSYSEPESPYNAIYPYNHVTVTESGHVVELDDTPDAERLQWYHRTGTFTEWHPNGDSVQKTVGTDYVVSMKARHEHVEGQHTLTVDKGQRILVNTDEETEGYVLEVGAGGDLSVTVRQGNANLNVSGDGNVNVSGNVTINVSGDADIDVAGNANVNCPQTDWTGNISLNGDLDVSGEVVASEEVTANGITLTGHTHKGNVPPPL